VLVLEGVLTSVLRLPLLFRGDVMRQSSLTILAVGTPPMLVFLALKVRSGMRMKIAALWAFLGFYAAWAAGLLFGERGVHVADPHVVETVAHWMNLVPFATIAAQVRAGSGSALVQLVGNLGLLLPLGLIGPVVMPSLRRVPRLLSVALGASVLIELVQLVGTTAGLFNRSVDVDDVILNVAGALLGWLLWRGFASLRARGARGPAGTRQIGMTRVGQSREVEGPEYYGARGRVWRVAEGEP
jgi:glycopeptide antibiotics resistance protein